MFATTFVAGVDNVLYNYLPKHTFQGNMNAFLSAVMLVLVWLIYFESIRKSVGFLRQGSQAKSLAGS